MDITLTREALLFAATQPARIANGGTLPILGHLLLQAGDGWLALTGTSLELEITARCPTAQCGEPGECTVPAKKLYDITRALPSGADVRLRLHGERVLCTSSRGRYILGTLPVSDFPRAESTLVDSTPVRLTAGQLGSLIGKVQHAMASNDVRYYLNGMLLELEPTHLRAVATDGHRLAAATRSIVMPETSQRSIILPGHTVREFARALTDAEAPITLEFGSTQVRLMVGQLTLTSKLVDASYPDWQRVVPTGLEQIATVARDDLLQALSRTNILANDTYHGVRATFAVGQMQLRATNQAQEESHEEIAAEYDGPECTIGYCIHYLIDALRAITAERVEVHFSGPDTSTRLVDPESPDDVHVVMPMRL